MDAAHFGVDVGPTCTLKHDMELMPTQVSIANKIFTDCASKLKKPKQD